jgi:hypothetical protein
MIDQWAIAAMAFGAFICVGIGYFIRSLEDPQPQPQLQPQHDETEHGVGGTR